MAHNAERGLIEILFSGAIPGFAGLAAAGPVGAGRESAAVGSDLSGMPDLLLAFIAAHIGVAKMIVG